MLRRKLKIYSLFLCEKPTGFSPLTVFLLFLVITKQMCLDGAYLLDACTYTVNYS